MKWSYQKKLLILIEEYRDFFFFIYIAVVWCPQHTIVFLVFTSDLSTPYIYATSFNLSIVRKSVYIFNSTLLNRFFFKTLSTEQCATIQLIFTNISTRSTHLMLSSEVCRNFGEDETLGGIYGYNYVLTIFIIYQYKLLLKRE